MKRLLAAIVWIGAGVFAGPGFAQQIDTSGIKSGSAVLYPLFRLDDGAADNPHRYVTQLRITNNHPTDDVWVRLVRVCGAYKSANGRGVCEASNREVKLAHHQTQVWNVQQFFSITPGSPGVACETQAGYILAYAQAGENDSTPIKWNSLSGSVYMRRVGALYPNATASSQALVILGDPMDAVAEGEQLLGSAGGPFPQLPFDDIGYARFGSMLQSGFRATANMGAPFEARRSAIALLTLDILAGSENDPTVVAIDWYNESEDRFSTSVEYVCHFYAELQDIDVGFNQVLLGSAYGTVSISPIGTDAIQGQLLEIEPNRELLHHFQ